MERRFSIHVREKKKLCALATIGSIVCVPVFGSKLCIFCLYWQNNHQRAIEQLATRYSVHCRDNDSKLGLFFESYIGEKK